MYAKTIVIKNPTGLHARPASELVAAAKKFASTITIKKTKDDGKKANAKSIITVLAMGMGQGESIEISAEGADEQQAVDDLCQLIESGFGEV